jgi:hypothetical protein
MEEGKTKQIRLNNHRVIIYASLLRFCGDRYVRTIKIVDNDADAQEDGNSPA